MSMKCRALYKNSRKRGALGRCAPRPRRKRRPTQRRTRGNWRIWRALVLVAGWRGRGSSSAAYHVNAEKASAAAAISSAARVYTLTTARSSGFYQVTAPTSCTSAVRATRTCFDLTGRSRFVLIPALSWSSRTAMIARTANPRSGSTASQPKAGRSRSRTSRRSPPKTSTLIASRSAPTWPTRLELLMRALSE